MAKVQAYVSDEIVYKINKIVERRRAEGAKSTDVSFSSISTMLLELGLRVYEAQMERKESAFNQAEFNKVLLECAVKTQSTVAKILGIESLSPHVSGNPKFEYANMVEDIRDKVSSEMERFFPENEALLQS
ncbi:conjugal transfer relaxosome DNA-binding protein TraM [Escherichia coli]|nr:conjugal transfer relaxosome DNA-binding protein TraM [Escherichia coli]MDL9723710.1 conjugal transfer relaxosome DNA-binding protein TraM [Escherichia coli]MDL9807465.1 conjugal transfer relaxosome DNA-binding protein TraM [Escherichia coli]MDL9812412.1 conjugal transfer relaxosome DNA-binding protein TraM [Escherichia coli]MDL9817342.1 conjugal transfer relaxosome DNA-binding protein TraM [Escherichia coli]